MSADSVHHKIEQGLQKHGDVCDWVEFKSVLSKAKCNVLDLEGHYFFDFVDGSNRAQLSKAVPRIKLVDMCAVLFQRGSRSIKYKISHSINHAEYKSINFLKKKFNVNNFPSSRSAPRGVPASKRIDIIKKLCPLMPANRQQFWEQLPTDDYSLDLITDI